jgi:ribosomal protein L20
MDTGKAIQDSAINQNRTNCSRQGFEVDIQDGVNNPTVARVAQSLRMQFRKNQKQERMERKLWKLALNASVRSRANSDWPMQTIRRQYSSDHPITIAESLQ